MTAAELREKYLEFFKTKGHAVIESASLIPENDPTVLFTTAGMHPLVPYLMGEKHPSGKRLADVQKCVRTGDIDEVGDASHCTFFEMLGNWSLGDYFKEDAIAYSWEFLTSKDWLGLDPDKLYFTCFEGDQDAPKDMESYDNWIKMGVDPSHIFFLPKKYNWWGPAGLTGPCGPDSEMFMDTGKEACGPDCSPACSCGKYLEIWNDVFMQYNKKADGTFEPLSQQNVDTGMGLDRTITILQGKASIYDTDVFSGILDVIARLSGKNYGDGDEITKAFRIIADHMRCSTFILGDDRGVTPSNVDQGYVLRRLIRRAVRYGRQLGIEAERMSEINKAVIAQYEGIYPELARNKAKIIHEIDTEVARFAKTLEKGIKEFSKVVAQITSQIDLQGITDSLKTVASVSKEASDTINIQGVSESLTTLAKAIGGQSAFHLYDTFGFPVEMTAELAREKGLSVDMDGFAEAFKKHQELSQAGASQRFKGGLADSTEQTAKLHTATHLLHAALREVLGDTVAQKGSNITAERLRFDFSFERKMTPEEIAKVQAIVNDNIAKALPVTVEEMPLEKAKVSGAIGLFESKYDQNVKVYTMGGASKEICGGPHANNTAELGSFKIKKEESSSAGVRRIKAVLG